METSVSTEVPRGMWCMGRAQVSIDCVLSAGPASQRPGASMTAIRLNDGDRVGIPACKGLDRRSTRVGTFLCPDVMGSISIPTAMTSPPMADDAISEARAHDPSAPDNGIKGCAATPGRETPRVSPRDPSSSCSGYAPIQHFPRLGVFMDGGQTDG